MHFISRFGRFHKDFPLKEGTMPVPLQFSRNRPENHSHNLGKALGEGLGLLCMHSLYFFHLPIPFTSLLLSPLYPFHLSIAFTSLSLSPLSLFHPSLYLSFYLFFSLSPSLSLLSIIIFGISNGFFLSLLCIWILLFHIHSTMHNIVF